jgi:hypothetical protein
MTYTELIRIYSRSVNDGHSDTDLPARERRLVHVMLNLASNANAGSVAYPPTDETRNAVVRHLSDILWDARALVLAASPASDDALSAAHERAVTILHNI